MTDAIWVAIVAAVPGTIAAVMTYFNRAKIDNVRLEVNGRMTELLRLTETSSHALGVKDEKEHAATSSHE